MVDLQINKVESIINNLNELKVSIISAIVTGKIDVRGITVPEYEHVDEIADDSSEDASEDENFNGEAE